MKHVLTGCAGCSLMMLVLSGCGPELAQTQLGAEEEQWQSQIQSSYSSWRAPRSAPPAVSDNRDPSLVAKSAGNEDGASSLTVEPKDGGAEQAAPDTVGIPKDAQDSAAKNAPAEQPASAPAPAAESETYVVQKGDTLSLLAKKFYGDGRQYMKIQKANEAVLNGKPNRIYPGMKLTIPKN